MSASDSPLQLIAARREIRLADLQGLAMELAEKVRQVGFVPEVIVYVETGACLFAHEFAAVMPLPVVPVRVRRGGHGLKKRLAPWLIHLPKGVTKALRWLEERSGVQRMTSRRAELATGADLAGRRILLLDDAADTGRTMIAARELLLAAGVRSEDLRSAVIAATMAEGRASVDFYLLENNCCMPWSSDSEEREEAERLAAKWEIANHATRGF